MKTLGVSLVVVIGLFVMFVVGLITAQTPLSIASFCMWTPATLTLGYAVGRLGLKIAIQSGAR